MNLVFQCLRLQKKLQLNLEIKWDRNVSFSTAEFSPEVIAKLREENEALTLPDLWKMPTDQEFIEMSRIMDEMKNNYIAARDTMNGNSNSSVIDEDDIPF